VLVFKGRNGEDLQALDLSNSVNSSVHQSVEVSDPQNLSF
jgi:hypothetical protein